MGVNGSGKTTLLRVVAALWENFGSWLSSPKTLNPRQQGQQGLLLQGGLAAMELIGLQPFPVWLFMATNNDYHEEFVRLIDYPDPCLIGEIRGAKGRPKFIFPKDETWFVELSEQKKRLELMGNPTEKLPNLVFLDAENRTLGTPQKNGSSKISYEPLYQWLVTYGGQERWEGDLETMIRNLKIRDVAQFKKTLMDVSDFLGDGKRIADFDDNLRLRVQIGKRKTDSHLLEELSSGEKQCLILLFMASRWLMEGSILLIDEPDLHLHVSLQRQLIHQLEQIVHAKNGQLLITSHSPTMWEEFSERQRIRLGEQTHEQV